MNLNALKAKVKRNSFIKYAGRDYRDETSEIIVKLRDEGFEALIGIQRQDRVYTILGEKFVHYLTPSGIKGKISHGAFSNELHDNAMSKGKFWVRYKYLELNNGDRIWLKNKLTMSALWNILLWLENLNDEVKI